MSLIGMGLGLGSNLVNNYLQQQQQQQQQQKMQQLMAQQNTLNAYGGANAPQIMNSQAPLNQTSGMLNNFNPTNFINNLLGEIK
jgi:type II secretory pathway pseudopilin PulG